MSSRHLLLHASAVHPLRDLLLAEGVEFPCGGEGTCGACKVHVVHGEVPISPSMRDHLSADDLHDGWRLGCCAAAEGSVELEVREWQTLILGDEQPVPIEPREGFGAIVDLGTTTVVVQCVSLHTGEIVGTASGLNVEARFGADVMSRVQHALTQPGILTQAIRAQIASMLGSAAADRTVTEVLLVGNTVMHHLFCGEDVEPLTAAPFRSPALGARRFRGAALGWDQYADAQVLFLPCIGGFVGSDLLVGLLASGIADATQPEAMFDLGTNGEIAITTAGSIFCASTAAGPAFEGGLISCGMRAGPGAIAHFECNNGQPIHQVIGGGPAQGICGSGLLDAVSCALEGGILLNSGRLSTGNTSIVLNEKLQIIQRDIRELQFAKAAIASGLELLQDVAGGVVPRRIHLAGAFGNYIREKSARRTGMLPAGGAAVHPAGNTALRGARLLLLQPSKREEILPRLLSRVEHVELAALPRFQDTFIEALAFPES